MKRLVLLCALFIAAGSAVAAPAITVFTFRSNPATGIDRYPSTVYFVDDAQALNRQISAGLPNNATDAKAEAIRRLNTPDGAVYLKSIGPAVEHLVIAWMWGVRAFPAVVLEEGGNRSVVYGTADSARAVALWDKQRGW